MSHFATIYIHPMQGANIPHAFLGLTHTHPDELDSLKDIDIYKYQAGYYSDKPTLIHVKDMWYNNIYPSILDSNFGGEGFFGFGPYETSLFNNYQENQYNTGGKVFQNNHWNDESKKETENNYNKLKENLKNQPLPRIPQNSKDKQYLIFSKDFTLTTMRPLKTFQKYFSEIIEINQNEYEKIAKQVLFHTLLSSDSIRQNAVIFSNEKNEFKNYKVVGNSCVDFVMDKLQLIGASKFDKATTIIPYEVRIHVRDNKPNFYNKQKGKYKNPLSKYDKISYLLQDINLFYQNYATLCQIDSTWECKKGFNTFCLYYANLITLDNYIFPLTFNEEHTKALGNTKHLRENQIPFAFEKEFLNIKQEYNNYQQACSINGDTPLTFNEFKLNIKQDDLARRVNTGIYIANELKDIKTKMHEDSKISLLIFQHEKERFGIANADNDFSYQDFDLSHIDSTTNMASYAYAIKRNSLVVANNLKYYGNITQESMQTYIKVMIAKASEEFDDSHDTISLAKAYYTQQEKDNA